MTEKLDLDTFCYKLSELGLKGQENVYPLLEYLRRNGSESVTSSYICTVLKDHSVANLNATRLRDSISNDPQIAGKGKFRLKDAAGRKISKSFPTLFERGKPDFDSHTAYLPKDVWKETDYHIDYLATEINACYQENLFNGCAVLIRRLTETFICASYRQLGRESEVQDQDGNFKMLKKLIDHATGNPGLPIGRDAKKALVSIKELGDRSAHNIYFLATKADLDSVRSGFRVVADELIAIAALRKTI